jgi:hypothetical protein
MSGHHGSGPPGKRVGPARQHRAESVADQRRTTGKSVVILAHRDDEAPEARPTTDVEEYLLALVARCDDVPLISELTAADIGTARGTAAISRAALAWLRDGQPDSIRARLETQLREDDRLAIWRLRQMSADLSDAEAWGEVGRSIARARVARNLREDGYKPLDRTPDPWPPESLDPANWREAGPPSPNVWPDKRFQRHDRYFERGA